MRAYFFGLRRGSGWWLLLLLSLLGRQGLAQRAYWEAQPDSLERVLTQQHTDTARLRTVQHLLRMEIDRYRWDEYMALVSQAATLTGRLHLPAYPAYRQQLAGERLRTIADAAHDSAAACEVRQQAALAKFFRTRETTYNRRALDSLQAASLRFDALGYQEPTFLSSTITVFDKLRQRNEVKAYLQGKLAGYKQRGAHVMLASCYRILAGFSSSGDYNQEISYSLQAAEQAKSFSSPLYSLMLSSVGRAYAQWGNYVKAQHYLQLALAATDQLNRLYILYALAEVYERQKNYPAAIRAADLATQAASQNIQRKQIILDALAVQYVALCVKTTALISLHRLAEAQPLLFRLQQQVDTARLTGNGNITVQAFSLAEIQATYYTAQGDWGRAGRAWLTAYRQFRNSNFTASLPLKSRFLRALADFYNKSHQPNKAIAYSLAATALSDSMQATHNRYNVSYYEQQAVERRQAGRIASLRQTQAQAEARARHQRFWLLAALGGLTVVGGGAGLLWRLYRQKQRANALLAAQKAQIEEQAARLGELDEAKNQFFANVSHELRTPLTLVLGPLDTLLTDPAQALPAAVRAPVALAHRQAQRLEQLVNRILDLTKLQAGRLALHPKPTPLGALLRRVVTQFESLAAQRGISLPGPPALPDELRVLLEADKVEEILTNLLINALNHTPAGGTVRVMVALPGPDKPDNRYSVTVQDTGPGIAASEQARVFERFYQSPQRHAQGGTGLGLALSRELAHLLGGTLTLQSEPGRGAAFTLRFPAPTLPPAPSVPPEATPAHEPVSRPDVLLPPASAPRPRVLVVEDQPDLREYLRTLLAPTYEVLMAEDGQAALDLLAREAPVDLITTDAMMPRLSGTELLARLRADPAQAPVPVLMLTARADEAYRLAAFTVGVDDYLTKPFATAELRARVRALLAHQQVRRHFAALPPDEEPEPAPTASPAAPEPPRLTDAAATVAVPPTRRKPAPASAAVQLGRWQEQVAGRLADEQFGPAELAELLCLSERTLYRRLGELAGLTPAAWLRELRLAQARRLLEAGGFGSVAEVADAVGFASPKYFATLYAERFGRRPADYPM